MVTTGLGPRRSAVLRLLVVAVALAGALIGALGGAAPASAHAALTGSTPAQGSVVDQAPEQVTLTFSEGVAMGDNSIRVLDPQGKRVDRGKLRNLCSDSIVKYGAGLPPGLRDGTYTVTWQAVSADSHPVAGAFTFSVGAPSKTAAPVPEQKVGGGLTGALYGIARYLAYAGFVLLVGGAAFVLACRPAAALVRSVQRLVVQGWALLAGTTIAMLLLRSPYTGSGDLADAFDLARSPAGTDHQAGRGAGLPAAAARRGGAVRGGALREYARLQPSGRGAGGAGRARRVRQPLRCGEGPEGAGQSPNPGAQGPGTRAGHRRRDRRRRARGDLGNGRTRLDRSPAGRRDAGRCAASAGGRHLAGRAGGAGRVPVLGAARRAGRRTPLLADRVRLRGGAGGHRRLPVLAAGRLLARADRHHVRVAAAAQGGAGRGARRDRLGVAAVDGTARRRSRTAQARGSRGPSGGRRQAGAAEKDRKAREGDASASSAAARAGNGVRTDSGAPTGDSAATSDKAPAGGHHY